VSVAACIVVFEVVLAPAEMTEKLAGVKTDQGEIASALAATLGVGPEIQSILSHLPIGDYAIRLALMFGGISYFIGHPWGVGFGGELSAMGQFAHHDLVRIAVELGIAGLTIFVAVATGLVSLSKSRLCLDRRTAPMVVAVQAITGATVVAMCCAVSTVFSLKYGVLYWTLLGVVDGAAILRRDAVRRNPRPKPQPSPAGIETTSVITAQVDLP
jgi:hypothetical protein